MLEANAGFSSHSSLLHTYGDSYEEELSVLPRHTKVVVTGNNRTKSVLVGLQDVVKKVVGLGGWHWLVLTNGIDVKLQRNALSVLEPPIGNEEDDYLEIEHEHWNSSDIGRGIACNVHLTRLSVDLFPLNSQLKDSITTTTEKGSSVDLGKLEMAALWRYALHFNLVDVIPNPCKEQLIEVVQRHFVSQVISGFAQAAKRLKSVCK